MKFQKRDSGICLQSFQLSGGFIHMGTHHNQSARPPVLYAQLFPGKKWLFRYPPKHSHRRGRRSQHKAFSLGNGSGKRRRKYLQIPVTGRVYYDFSKSIDIHQLSDDLIDPPLPQFFHCDGLYLLPFDSSMGFLLYPVF